MMVYPPSVELATLREQESARGTRHMSGYLGRARLTLLPSEPTEDGTATWPLLIAQPADRGAHPAAAAAQDARSGGPGTSSSRTPQSRGRAPYAAQHAPAQPDSTAPLDDPVSDLWREPADAVQ